MMTRIGLVIGFLSLCFASVACTSGPPQSEGSVLIFAVSGLNADDIGDGSSADNLTPNIEKLVKESVRFTHAYTTSPLENAGLASLFTGLYPSEHGVRHNGASVYPKAVQSLPEVLATARYTNIFMSGGPPLLRKSAVSIGFHDFDDSFIKADDSYFMPAKDLADKFISFYENRMEKNKFLGVIYFADFLFPDGATKDKRLQEVDAAIGKIRDRLNKNHKWDGLTVIFTSLRGSGRFESLYDEVVRIPLVIKPARTHRDLSPSWKIDEGVTFADVGATLYSLLGQKPAIKSQFDVRDFSSYLFAKNTKNEERTLYIESDLLNWRHWGSRLYALRRGEWVFFPIEKKLFNTYTDRGEINNLYNKDKDATLRMESVWWKDKDFLMKDGYSEKLPGIFLKLDVAKILFAPLSTPLEKKTAFDDFYLGHRDWQVNQWYLKQLYENKNDKIVGLIKKLKPETKSESKELALWKKIYGLANKTYLPSDCEGAVDLIRSSVPLTNLERYSIGFFRDCRDHETQAWLQAYLNFKAKKLKEASALYDLASALSSKRRDQTVLGKYFWLNNATWDLEPEYPAGLSTFEFIQNKLGQTEFENFVKKRPAL